VDANADIRDALRRHMVQGTWQIVDQDTTMEISGVLAASQVRVHLRGGRREVLEVMEGLIRALVTTGRLPG
jgi:hypothetical protein